MTRVRASDRMQRVLAIVPWIAAHDGPRIDDICARFGLTRDQLIRDIDIASFVGLAPYTPEQLVEVTYDDERVWVHYPRMFTHPLRLTPEEGLGLLAAGAAALDLPGADVDGPLATALAKLAGVLGVNAGDLDVDLGEAPADAFEALQQAIAEQRPVELDYYSYARDERSHRVIEPWRLWSEQGSWYVSGHCRSAGGERVFRLDRIADATVLDEHVEAPPGDLAATRFSPDESTPRVTLDLDPSARWVVETYPAEQVTELADGRLRIVLAVTATPWLERLVLGLGPSARIVDIDPRLGDAGLAAAAARRVLSRYDDAVASPVRE
jgi:proteasome accessory factor C